MERFKEKARQVQAEAQQKLALLQAEGEKIKQTSIENLEAAKEAAKQKAAAASLDVSKLKESVATRANSFGSLGLLPAAGSEGIDPSRETVISQSSEVRPAAVLLHELPEAGTLTRARPITPASPTRATTRRPSTKGWCRTSLAAERRACARGWAPSGAGWARWARR